MRLATSSPGGTAATAVFGFPSLVPETVIRSSKQCPPFWGHRAGRTVRRGSSALQVGPPRTMVHP